MRTLTHDGLTLSVREWSLRTGLQVAVINDRVRSGLSDSDALIAYDMRGKTMAPSRARIDFDMLPWDEDDCAWYIVACHPDGVTLEDVGSLLGVTRERVRQIEETALRKYRILCWMIERLPKRATASEHRADVDRLLAQYQGKTLEFLERAKRIRQEGKTPGRAVG